MPHVAVRSRTAKPRHYRFPFRLPFLFFGEENENVCNTAGAEMYGRALTGEEKESEVNKGGFLPSFFFFFSSFSSPRWKGKQGRFITERACHLSAYVGANMQRSEFTSE